MNSPFNEAKYKALLEGLEVSIVNYSEAKSIVGESRWDSEYFKKVYLETYKTIHRLETKPFYLFCDFIKKGIFDLPPSNYRDKGIPLIRTTEIKDPTISFNSTVYLEEETNKANYKTILFPYDLVFTKIGAYIGDVAMLPTKYSEYNFSQNVAGAFLKNKNDGPFLLAFFLSNLGKKQILRSIMLSGQGKLELDDIRNYEIPILSEKFKNIIKQIIDERLQTINDAELSYNKAEQILLEELGLKDFEPSNEPVNIKSFKESFLATGRLDAEYYQKKYEDYLNLITSYKNGYELFSVACNLKDKNFNPLENKQYKYIELANIGKTGDINGCTIAEGKGLPTRARRIVNENDVIISSIEGSLDSCALITKEYDKALCSTGFYVINSKKINSETLLILFKSEPMQNILKKGCSGTILTAINKTELEQIPIPLIDQIKQQEIAELVEESFALKKQSEELLETAKRAVEMAIEESEEKAIEYINSKSE